MLIMWAILRRTGCLQRKHLLVLGLLPLVGGVLLVGIVPWQESLGSKLQAMRDTKLRQIGWRQPLKTIL